MAASLALQATSKLRRYQRGFRWAVWVGILVNLTFALPAVFAPAWLLGLLQLTMPDQVIWLRDAGLLLFFLSAMYVPAGLDSSRYRFNAVTLVLARLAFGVFWLTPVLLGSPPSAYLTMGVVDFSFGIVQGTLFLLLLREENRKSR